MEFNKILQSLRAEKKVSQLVVADFLGITKQAYSLYELGKRNPDNEMLYKISEYFDVSLDYLLGKSNIRNMNAIKKSIKIPVLGRVQAGIPIEAIEEILDYEEISTDMASTGEYFGLLIRGDSMIPRMFEKDVIIVKKQNDVDNGDIAVVLVNGDEATVKKIRKSPTGIELIPLNPSYETMYYTAEEVIEKPVAIIGKVVEVRGKI